MNAQPQSVRDEALVCCAVGDTQYALRGSQVRQIVRVEKMRGATGRDGRVGTLDVADSPVPVFRLGNILGGQRTSQGGGHHIAVTGGRGELVGWLVDRIARTSLAEDTRVAPLPPVVGRTAAGWFEALVKLSDRSVLLLAPRSLNPLARTQAARDVVKAARDAARRATAEVPADVVLLFSTPALPSRQGVTRFALSGRRIAAITQPMSPIPVPGAARHVTGVAWWRNAIVPIVDFRGPGDHNDAAERRRFLVAQCGTRLGSTLVAFPVDPDIAMHRPGAEDRKMTGAACPSFAAGMFQVGGEAVALLDLDALLAPESVDAGQGAFAHLAAG